MVSVLIGCELPLPQVRGSNPYLALVTVTNVFEGKVTVSSTVEVKVDIRRYDEQKAVACLTFRASTTFLIPSHILEGFRCWMLKSSTGEAVVYEMVRARAAVIQLRRNILLEVFQMPEDEALN